jgi:hypothetical protein
MFPQIKVRPERPKRPKSRPISPADSAATTGLPINPNGTYVANTFPQGNAMYGAQGQFGSGLPQVNLGVTPQPMFQTQPANLNAPPSQQTAAPFMTAQQAQQYGVQAPGIARPSSGITGVPPVGYGPQRPPQPASYPDFAQRPASVWQNINNIAQNILIDQNFLNRMSPMAQQEVEKFLTRYSNQPDPSKPFGGFTNTGGEKNTDYSQTASAQYYAATGRAFEDQERWVPGEGYVKIGKLIKQGRLDVTTGKMTPKGSKRNKKGKLVSVSDQNKEPVAATPAQAAAEYTLSSGFVNFNTSTG